MLRSFDHSSLHPHLQMSSYHPAFAVGPSFSASASAPPSSSRYVVRETPFAPYFDNSVEGEGSGVLQSWVNGAGGCGGSVGEDGKDAGGGGGRAHLEAQTPSSSDEEEDDGPPPRPLTPRPFQPRATGGFFPPTVRTFPSGRRRTAVSSNPAVGHSSSSSSSSLPFTNHQTPPHTFNLAFSAPPIGIIDSGHPTAYSFPNETPSSPTSAARPRAPTSSGSSESPPPTKKSRASKEGKGKGKKVAVEEQEEEEDSGMEDKEFTSHDPPGYSWGIPRSEYLALSAEKKKQLRNRVGAKIFRERRKKYLSELEGKIEERDEKMSKLEDQVAALTRELDKRGSR